MQNIVIAIDGPAGAGKSSIAKKIAHKINFTYIDSGAMYRALTLKILDNKIPLNNVIHIVQIAETTDINFFENKIFLDGKNVDSEIRSEAVNQNVSTIAAMPQVRRIMVDKQRSIANNKNVVMDGRDVGTVIFPDAFIKFYITASVEERAKRRFKQLIASNQIKDKSDMQLDEIKKQIEKRDFTDMTRSDAPLKAAMDAIYIDTSEKSFKQVFDEVSNYIVRLGGDNYALSHCQASIKTDI